jgi:hypothetical protein
MFRNTPVLFSINEIERIYPNQWVAVAVAETDADGFAASGQVIVHDDEEQFVWAAVKLGDADDPIYVFYTGNTLAVA